MKLLLSLSLLFTISLANASWYPPDYESRQSCKINGPVKVCVINNGSVKPYLFLEYTGHLIKESWGKIHSWVSVNGVTDEDYKLNNSNYTEKVYINKYTNIMLCWRNKAPEHATGEHRVCPKKYSKETTGSLVWYSEAPTEKDRKLFANVYPRQKEWDISIAIYDENGRWDSNNGNNYNFRFEDYGWY